MIISDREHIIVKQETACEDTVYVKYEGNDDYIYVPDGVTIIGSNAFSGSDAKQVFIPSSVAEIQKNAFNHCSITDISIPDSVFIIGDSAFSYCDNLYEITIPNNVYEIGSNAFLNCKNLKALNFPTDTRSLKGHTFAYCTNLEQLLVYGDIDEFGVDDFIGCDNLTIYCKKDSNISRYAEEHGIPYKDITPYTLTLELRIQDEGNDIIDLSDHTKGRSR